LVKIAVIDGEGGGIGATIIKRVREVDSEKVEVWALGTNREPLPHLVEKLVCEHLSGLLSRETDKQCR
jgi:hypothetical protein